MITSYPNFYRNNELCIKAETNISIRLKLCLRTFKLLRKVPTHDNPFRHSLYMNYDAFINSSNSLYPVCEMRSVESRYIRSHTVGEHMNLTCYGHPAIPYENDSSFLREISIFLGPKNSVIVFKCSHGYPNCTLLEWFEENEEPSFSELPTSHLDLLAMKVPRTVNKEKLNSIFKRFDEDVYKKRYVHIYVVIIYFLFYIFIFIVTYAQNKGPRKRLIFIMKKR